MPQKLIKSEDLKRVEAALRHLAEDFPTIRAEIERCHARIKKRFYYRGISADQFAIVRAVRDGYATAHEISERTLIAYVTVTKRLRELVRGGVLTTTRPLYAEGTGGDRSTKLYWLSGPVTSLLDQWEDAIAAKRRAEHSQLTAEIKAMFARCK